MAGRRPGLLSLDRRRLIGWAVVMPLIGGLIVFRRLSASST